jgi:CO/xanthine dehydrogenase Mo-binding subunit
VPELLEEGKRIIGWDRRQPPEAKTGRYRRGIGMARGFHTSSAGAPQPGDVIDYSGAMVKVNQDGSVDVITAVMDHGGGTLEAIAKLVAGGALRAAGEGEHRRCRHHDDGLRRGHPRHARRLRGRRRGGPGRAESPARNSWRRRPVT